MDDAFNLIINLASLITSITVLITSIVKIFKPIKHTINALKTLLLTEMEYNYEHIRKKGFARPFEKEKMYHLYDAYRKIGGNGWGTTMYEIVSDMPEEDQNGKEAQSANKK